jgi:hypothetical protein
MLAWSPPTGSVNTCQSRWHKVQIEALPFLTARAKSGYLVCMTHVATSLCCIIR